MAQQKKNIARLVLQGISVLGILFGFCCFLSSFAMISFIQTDDLFGLFLSVFAILWMLALGALFMYPSYKMLRGTSFLVIKSMAALLALTFFGSLMPYAEDITTYFNDGMSIEIKSPVELASFILVVFVSVLVYKVSVKLLEKLKEAAYGPNQISETKHSTDKQ
jgi:hypothetical protein